MKTVTIYTDGACSGNPGPGGWCAILEYNGHEKLISGGEARTTNNRMELTAVIQALLALREPCIVELYSDSKYVTDAFNKRWVDSWLKKNWKGSSGPVKNVDLWKRLLTAKEPHQVEFIWVKGHDGHPQNERCDQLATTAADGDGLIEDEGLND